MNNDIIWAAGLLEGEGCFSTKSDTKLPRIQCHMTDLDVLESLKELFGGNIYEITKRESHWKQAWVWSISDSSKAANVMNMLLPYMHSRKTQEINNILELFSEVKQRRKEHENLNKKAADIYEDSNKSLRQVGRELDISHERVRRSHNKYY